MQYLLESCRRSSGEDLGIRAPFLFEGAGNPLVDRRSSTHSMNGTFDVEKLCYLSRRDLVLRTNVVEKRPIGAREHRLVVRWPVEVLSHHLTVDLRNRVLPILLL